MKQRIKWLLEQNESKHKKVTLVRFGCRHTGGAEPCPVDKRNICRARTKLQRLEAMYGLSPAMIRYLLTVQDKKCALCGEPFKLFLATGKRKAGWVPDHCHKTGRVRALLCHMCNVKIGFFGDDPSLLDRAAAYLRKYAANSFSSF